MPTKPRSPGTSTKARKPRKLSPAKPPTPYVLQSGDIFRLHPDCCPVNEAEQTYEVLRVNAGSATCRSLAKLHTTVTSLTGQVLADFWKSGRPFHISPTSSVILISSKSRP